MAAKKRKLLITKEEHEIIVVRKGEGSIRTQCLECATEVEMATFDRATAKFGIPAVTLIRLINEGGVHLSETSTGHLLICLDSLRKLSREDRRF